MKAERSVPHYDVIVQGAGPAGLALAMRLLQLGYAVAVVEQQGFPRPQIGESLSPGIWGIADMLGFRAVLENSGFLPGLDAHVIWERAEMDVVPPAQRGPGLMVDRGLMDSGLLALAVECGLRVYQPDRVRKAERELDGWAVELQGGERMTGRWLVDARGRGGVGAGERIMVSPPTVAVWAEVERGDLPFATMIEALPESWMWGAPLVGGGFRVMAFVDADWLRRQRPEAVLRASVAASRAFAGVAGMAFKGRVETCLAGTYVHARPFQEGRMQVGEAAFALDPLSSSGVEKAMRFSVQAAACLHTAMNGGAEGLELAGTFYHEKMIDAVARHALWTREYYARSAQDGGFWTARSKEGLPPLDVGDGGGSENREWLWEGIRDRMGRLSQHLGQGMGGMDLSRFMGAYWERLARVNPGLRWVRVAALTGDRLEWREAVEVRGEPVAFVEEFGIRELLDGVSGKGTFAELAHAWSGRMTVERAVRVMAWLVERGVVG